MSEQASLRYIITPEGAELPIRLADRGARASALCLDLLFLFGATLVVFFLGAIFLAVFDVDGSNIGLIALYLGLFFLRGFYFIYFELKWNGLTPGKKISKIRVIDQRGRPLQARAIVARNLMRELEVFLPIGVLMYSPRSAGEGWLTLLLILWFGVFVLMPFFNKDRLRGGDMIAGTTVIQAPQVILDRDIAEKAPLDHYQFTPKQTNAYGIHELQVLENVLRKSDPKMMQEVTNRIARKISWEGEIQSPSEFLEAYYAALRRHLEGKMLFGVKRRDKFDTSN